MTALGLRAPVRFSGFYLQQLPTLLLTRVVTFDALAVARAVGNPLGVYMVMLGALVVAGMVATGQQAVTRSHAKIGKLLKPATIGIGGVSTSRPNFRRVILDNILARKRSSWSSWKWRALPGCPVSRVSLLLIVMPICIQDNILV
jgi:hypothetical protein